jgi:hypothetical protein
MRDLHARCLALAGTHASVEADVVNESAYRVIRIVPHEPSAPVITILQDDGLFHIDVEGLEVDTEVSPAASHEDFALGVVAMVARYGVRLFRWSLFGDISVVGAPDQVLSVVGRRRANKPTRVWDPWNSSLQAGADFEAMHPVLSTIRLNFSSLNHRDKGPKISL